MKRSAAGTFPSYKQAVKRQRKPPSNRKGTQSVARTRGAAATGEMKYFDCDRTATNIAACTTTWVAGTLVNPGTTINLGDAAVANPLCLFVPKPTASLNGRIGRKVKVYKIKVNGMIRTPDGNSATVSYGASRVRIILVMDKQTNAGPMTSAQLMNDGTNQDTTLCSYQNPNNFGRFRVLKDKMVTLQDPNIAVAAAGTDFNGLTVPFKFSVNFKVPIVVNFNATVGGTCADIIDNSFHMIAATNYVELTPTISYYSRVCYKE